jgi:hypothetical protein
MSFKIAVWFIAAAAGIQAANPPQPDKIGIFRPSRSLWAWDNGDLIYRSPPDVLNTFPTQNNAANIPVWGDWTGSGTVKMGVFNPNTAQWFLDTNGNGVLDNGDAQFILGTPNAGDIPQVGDWNGDGRAKVGIFQSGFWALDYNGSFNGTVGQSGYFGQAGNTPIVGRWDASSTKTRVGVFNQGSFSLDNERQPGLGPRRR